MRPDCEQPIMPTIDRGRQSARRTRCAPPLLALWAHVHDRAPASALLQAVVPAGGAQGQRPNGGRSWRSWENELFSVPLE